jgi:hypothetical protein
MAVSAWRQLSHVWRQISSALIGTMIAARYLRHPLEACCALMLAKGMQLRIVAQKP